MSDCTHEKVYANYVLTSCPPQYPWICRKCGEKGIDWGGTVWIDEYAETEKKFDDLRKIRSAQSELKADPDYQKGGEYTTGVVDGLKVALKILEKDEENDGRYEQGDSKETKA
jgi:hypothetical protein